MTYISQFPEAQLVEGAPHTQTGNPGMVTVDGPGVKRDGVIVHNKAEFFVDTTKAGQGPLRVIIADPEEREVQPEISHEDGVYTYRYTPTQKGEHSIFVSWCGEPVPESPFTVCVAKQPYKVSGPGVDGTDLHAAAPAELWVDGLRPGTKPLIKVSGPKGQLPSSYITTEDEEEENRCTAFYIPPVPGQYKIDVLIAGKHIGDSPYMITVEKRREESNMCFAKGPGVEGRNVETGRRTWFKVFTSGVPGHDKVETSVTGPSGMVPTQMTRISDAITKYTYIPTRTGLHNVVVKAGPKESESLLKFKLMVPSDTNGTDSKLFDPDDFVITGSGVSGKGASAGQLASIYIDTTKAGPTPVEAKVTPPGAEEEEVIELASLEENPAILEGEYLPETPGYYDVQISVASSPIKGFQVPIADPEKVKISSDQMIFAMPGDTFAVDCFTKDAGPGQISIECGTSPLKAEVKPVAVGHYQLLFTVPKEGRYTANVCYNGVPVSSPIQIMTGDPSKCKVSGPGINSKVLANEETHFIVDNSAAGFGEVETAIISPSGTQIDSSSSKIRGSQHKINYTPHEAGDHAIHILFAGHKLPESPYPVHVINPSAVLSTTDPCDRAELGETIKVFVDASRAGDGKLSLSVTGPEECSLIYDESSETNMPTFSFTPSVPGTYIVSTTLDGLPISDEPNSVTVTDISKVAVSGSGITGKGAQMGKGIQLGQPADVIVDTSESGPADVEALLILPTGETEGVTLQAEEEECPEMLVGHYTPTSPGYYSVDITFDKQPVPESPFQVRVVSPDEVSLTVGKAVVGEECEIDFFLDDVDSDEVAIDFTTPKGEKLPLEFTCEEMDSSDHCRIKFTPELVGDMIATLYYSETPVRKNVIIPVVDPTRCRVYGPGVEGEQMVGEETFLAVDTTEAGDGSLMVVPSGLDKVPLPTKLTEEQRGVYRVRYTPQEGGELTINVLYNDRDVPNSPFSVMVVNPSKVKVYGPGVDSKLLAGNQTHFTIDSTQAGSGRITVDATGPSNTRLQTTITEEQPGVHSVWYTPQEGGKTTVNVHFNDRPVPNTPYSVPVINPAAVSSQLSCPEVITLGDTVCFTVDTSGAGSGDLNVLAAGPEECITECKKRKKGLYDFSFTPTGAGVYTIQSEFDDIPTSQAPLSVKVLDLSLASVSEPTLPLVIGEEASFIIDASAVGEADLTATASMADGSQDELAINDTAEDNVYRATITPTCSGLASVTLQYAGKHIGKSPYSLPVIDPSAVVVTGLDYCCGIVDEQLAFQVDTSVAGGGGKLRAFAEGPGVCDVSLHEEEEGKYSGSLTTSTPGAYLLHMKYSEHAVPGSPFLCPFKRPPPDASKVIVENIDIPGQFTVDARHAGGNGVLEVAACGAFSPARYVNVEHNGDYTFKVSYEITEDAVLTIKWHGHHVPGSPFSLPANK